MWAYSVDGGVHLDATLRNFVDLPNLPDQSAEHLRPRIRVIDMDARLSAADGHDAQDRLWLWLYNVLVVSCFLKVAFEDHPEFRRVWWDRIRAAVRHVMSRRDAPRAGHAFVAQARWDTAACAAALRGLRLCDEPPWSGDTPEAAALTRARTSRTTCCTSRCRSCTSATWTWCSTRRACTEIGAASRSRSRRPSGSTRRRGARRCRGCTFGFTSRAACRPLVDAMIEFVDTRQETLVARYMHVVPQSQAHTESDLKRVVARRAHAAARAGGAAIDTNLCVNAR